MASPNPERPLRRPKRAEKPKRNLTSKEQRRKKTQNIVTWGLAFVFAITSVGFMIGFSSGGGRGDDAGPQSEVQVLQQRLKGEQDAAMAHPDQPQYHYSQSTTYAQLANAEASQGKADEAKGYMTKAVEQLRETLKIAPGHLPALKDLSAYDISEGKYQDAVDILTLGIKAEKDDIARRKTAIAATPAPSDLPPIQPDVDLRALLFAACASLPGKDVQAEEVAREGLTLNPKEFLGGAFGVGRTVMVLEMKNQPESAMRAAQIALKAANGINDKESVGQLQNMVGQIILARANAAAAVKASPAPSGAPAVGASPGGVIQAPLSPGPEIAPSPSGESGALASPVPPVSPVAPPAESAAPPAPPAQPAPVSAPSPGAGAGAPSGAPAEMPVAPAASPTP